MRKADWLARVQRDASNFSHEPKRGQPRPKCEFFDDAWMSRPPGALLRRRAGKRTRLPGGDDHLDGVFDPVSGISERGGQIGEREGMGVNLGRIEALFGH